MSICLYAFISTQGIADMHAASMMCVAGLMTASIGAKVNHLLPASSLSKLLAVVMVGRGNDHDLNYTIVFIRLFLRHETCRFRIVKRMHTHICTHIEPKHLTPCFTTPIKALTICHPRRSCCQSPLFLAKSLVKLATMMRWPHYHRERNKLACRASVRDV